MRIIMIACLGLATGCATLETEPRAAQPNCLERAELSPLNTSTAEERDAKAEIDRETKTRMGFAIEGADQPESHKLPSVLRPPIPTFSTCAATRGIEGECQVFFDVDASGKPINVVPVCSNAVFNREAARAVSRAEFSPATIDGTPVKYPGVIYPMSFHLNQ